VHVSQHSRVLPVDRWRPAWAPLRQAAAAIRRGELIGLPTDTLYGLAGDATCPGVAEKIFRIKKRPETKPILLLIDSPARLHGLVGTLSDVYRVISTEFWPGPLTLILPATKAVPREVTAGSGTVAVRWPAAPVVERLVRLCGCPLTGTSANVSGRPPATTAAEVNRQLGRNVYCILDAGPARTRRPSTILDLTGRPRILREGALSASRLKRYLG
jgi:L-threonylcarbamoyladenylate synthase